MNKGEFELIDFIRTQFKAPAGVTGIGDDCAILPQTSGNETLVSTDMLIEGVHFLLNPAGEESQPGEAPGDVLPKAIDSYSLGRKSGDVLPKAIDPYSLGWKSAAVNISDIAAMGGRPTGSFLSIAIPSRKKIADSQQGEVVEEMAESRQGEVVEKRDGGKRGGGAVTDGFMEEFIRGYKDLSDKFDCPLLGGDTTSSPDRLCISVTVTGECPAGRALRRSAAYEGDWICVTGPLGDSAAGLHAILNAKPETDITKYLVNKHFRPMPRVDEGLILTERHRTGIGAAMDISDGIGSDIRHIMEESKAGARIDVSRIPMSRELQLYCRENGLDPLDFALSGGEDYELLFTCAKGTHLPFDFWVIGEITSTGTLEWAGSDKDYQGFRHF